MKVIKVFVLADKFAEWRGKTSHGFCCGKVYETFIAAESLNFVAESLDVARTSDVFPRPSTSRSKKMISFPKII